MTFEKEKRNFLIKIDKSKKGTIDKEIKELVLFINTLPKYYTKSSCAGRVVLLKKKSDKKQEAEWLFVKHGLVTYKEILYATRSLPREEVWFKQEPLIMHVCCKTIEDADKLLKLSKSYFKRTGIIGIKKSVTIEIIGTDILDTIISKNGKLLISDEYLRILINEANKKLKRNSKKILGYYKKITTSF